MDLSPKRVGLIMTIVLAVLGVRFVWQSIDEIWEINDFEVFYWTADLAAQQDPSIYTFRSPVKERPFLYPPSAAVLFIPLTWLPFDATAVVYSLFKVACLAVLLAAAVRLSGAPPPDRPGWLLLIGAVIFVMFRSIDNDLGNGQINTIVAACGVGGVWLMMATKRGWAAGGALLAAAVAIKLTPLLLAAIPLLHRRWKALGAFVVALVVLMVILPRAWFGPDGYHQAATEHRDLMASFITDGRDADRQVTAVEMVHFTLGQWRADPDDYIVERRELHQPGPDGELVHVRLPETMSPLAARILWLTIGGAAAALFFVARRRILGGDWAWDLAMLCTLMIFLSPRVRKAHLVILIVPTAWLACRVFRIIARGEVRAFRGVLGVLAATIVLFYISENLPIPAPGFPLPYRPLLFVAVILYLWVLTLWARDDPAEPRLQ
jgi:hypothetical protein